MFRILNIFISAVIVLVLGWTASASAQQISLDACLQKAIENNKKLQAEEIGAEVAENDRKSIRGRFLPVLRAEVNAMIWDDNNIYSFDMSPLAQMIGGGGAGNLPAMNITIRDDMTLDTSLIAIQPLTGLYPVWFAHKAKKHMAEAARQMVVTTRHDIEREVINAFFSHLAASQMLESAEAALKQVEAFEKMTADYLKVEMVERNALLKIQVQRAEIQKAIFQAKKGVHLTRSMLNMYMGRPLSTPLEISYDPTKMSEELMTLSVDVLQERSMENRPDLLSARSQKIAAESGHQASIGQMLPEINLVGRYQNSQGMGDMMPEHQLFGGLMLTWNFWEWGAGYYKVKSSEARALQAKRLIEFAEEGIRLDVEQKRLDLDESVRQHEVALVRFKYAQENLRIETSRYEVQESTNTDLLQAQTSELHAKNDVILAKMQIEVAARELMLSTGQDLLTDNTSL